MQQQLVQFIYEVRSLPETLWQQYPVAITAILLVVVGAILIKSTLSKKRQQAVDHRLAELADRQKTSTSLFMHQLRMIGLIDRGERLVLAGKYGPGIASESALAKVVARLMLDHLISSERLARDIVDHFMTELNLKFNKRRGHLEAFWSQVGGEFSDRIDEEIVDQSLLDGAIARHLAQHLRTEDVRLAYLADQKSKKTSDKRHRAFGRVYGVEKTPLQVWWTVCVENLKASAKKLKALPIKALF